MKKIKKEFRLHPALLFFCLTILIMIVSSIGGILHLETSYYTVNSVTGNLESKIVVINNGEVAEVGTHNELIKISNGQYRTLYEMQFKKQKI